MSDQTTLKALRDRAGELSIEGRTKMDAPELEAAIAAAEQAQTEALARAATAEAESARTVRAGGRPPLAEVAAERYETAVSQAIDFGGAH